MDAQETAQGVGWYLRYHNGRKMIERSFIALESMLDFMAAMNLTDRIEIQRVK